MLSRILIESELSSSSVMPSEKYSCFASPLMFTNGRTAIECGGWRHGGQASQSGRPPKCDPTTRRVLRTRICHTRTMRALQRATRARQRLCTAFLRLLVDDQTNSQSDEPPVPRRWRALSDRARRSPASQRLPRSRRCLGRSTATRLGNTRALGQRGHIDTQCHNRSTLG
jgi:hypothetical protein